MAGVMECVPNFSEGRRPEVIRALADAAGSTPGVTLLDVTSDESHNRCVVTFAGDAEQVGTAALEAVGTAVALIDMRGHAGVHPRIGAADVVPFVPLVGTTMQDAVRRAHLVGRAIAEELEVPVYLYGEAALVPERRRLASIRRGGLETLGSAIAHERRPDFGPSRVHPTAGAVAVGARPPLIAFNINLAGAGVEVAYRIAIGIRESSGGMPAVQAMGVEVVAADGRSMAQVSTNLLDWQATGIADVVAEVRGRARAAGADIDHCELIGLAPAGALRDAHGLAPGIPAPNSDRALEVRLAAAGLT